MKRGIRKPTSNNIFKQRSFCKIGVLNWIEIESLLLKIPQNQYIPDYNPEEILKEIFPQKITKVPKPLSKIDFPDWSTIPESPETRESKWAKKYFAHLNYQEDYTFYEPYLGLLKRGIRLVQDQSEVEFQLERHNRSFNSQGIIKIIKNRVFS